MKLLLRVVALTVVLTFVVVVLLYFTEVPSQESVPCDACVSMTSSLHQVSVCDLTHGHSSNLVRVHGMFSNDAGQLYLRDGGCTVVVGLTEEKRGCRGAWRKLQVVSGIGTWYDGEATVAALGATGPISAPNYFAGNEGFTIVCLEEVNTSPNSRTKVNFLLHRLMPGAHTW